MMDILFQRLIERIQVEALTLFGDNLRALVIFGSVARNAQRSDSDIDILFVFKNLPENRRQRTDLVAQLEENLEKDFQEMRNQGIATCISPIIKSSDEATFLSPIYLDMLEDATIILDHDGLVESVFERLRTGLDKTKGRRIWKGQRWYWDLKPDLQFGEVFEIE